MTTKTTLPHAIDWHYTIYRWVASGRGHRSFDGSRYPDYLPQHLRGPSRAEPQPVEPLDTPQPQPPAAGVVPMNMSAEAIAKRRKSNKATVCGGLVGM